MSNFSCEDAVFALREKGYTVTESKTTVFKGYEEYNIDSFTITLPNRLYTDGRAEIYDRSQYATDEPRVGLFIGEGGMCYGSGGGRNFRIESMEDLLERIGRV